VRAASVRLLRLSPLAARRSFLTHVIVVDSTWLALGVR
jgi:hypothetical protein